MVTSIAALPAHARVWIYQSNRPFTAQEKERINGQLQAFAEQWTSHNRALRAAAELVHDRFIVLMVDESMADASGCSIDKSVNFLKALQAEYGVDLFDRMRFSYRDDHGRVDSLPREAFAAAYAAGQLTDDTPVFDPLVPTKEDYDQGFVKPLGKSWHKRMV